MKTVSREPKASAPWLLAIALLAAFTCRAGVDDFKITTDHAVDASSLESIVRDAVRLAGAKTNDEKAIAIYEWLHLAIFHRQCPLEKPPQTVGPLKALDTPPKMISIERSLRSER